MDKTKRQNLPTLYVIATPIGNLSDISPRAKLALECTDTILCEDTRETRKLLSALHVKAPRLERFDAHTDSQQIEIWVNRLKDSALTEEAKCFALVSDAGTPAISDPGALLVKRAREVNVSVIPIPGPSALATFLSAAGFSETAFTFRGFFPKKEKEQIQELALCNESQTSRLYVWFESPKRIQQSLERVAQQFSAVQVVAAKELTKIYEQFFSGVALDVYAQVKKEIADQGERGEWCFAILFEDQTKVINSSDWVNSLEKLLKSRLSAPRAARQISQYFGIPRKTVYEMALKICGKK